MTAGRLKIWNDLAGEWEYAPGGAPGGGSQPVLMVSKTLTSAELLALHTTAVEVLPAPSGRHYYTLHYVIYHYRFGTTPYAGGDAAYLILGYGSNLAEALASPSAYPLYNLNNTNVSTALAGSGSFEAGKDFLTNTADVYCGFPVPSVGQNDWGGWAASEIEGAAIMAANGDVAYTDGDGELSIRAFYSLIDGAPA